MVTLATPPNSAPRTRWLAYALAPLACGAVALLATPFHNDLDLTNIAMLFLLAVALLATRLGRGPAVLASVCSVALFDYFFVPPRFSFDVSHTQYLLTFVVMLAVALIITHLTAGIRQQAQAAARRERESRGLYRLAAELGGALQIEQVERAISAYLRQELGAAAGLFLPDAEERLRPVDAGKRTLSLPDQYAARSALESGRPVETATTGAEDQDTYLLPLVGATRTRGVLHVCLPDPGGAHFKAQAPLLEAVAALAATAVERIHFVAVAQQTQVQVSAERLRNSVLSALSHDLRTPLTAVYGLADALTVLHPPLPDAARDIALALREQSMRLSRMVANLLDMARLQAGPIELRREWQPLEEVIGAALKLQASALVGHPLHVRLAPDLPLLEFDAVLMERVFCNLLENAAKYSPPGAAITIAAEATPTTAEISVTNDGSRFPPERLPHLFEPFVRGEAESALPGVGLGLTICKAVAEAHGGTLRAENVANGARVLLSIPLGTPPLLEAEAQGSQEAP